MSAKSVLVVGGGPAGLRAALDLADMGVQVHLVERRGELGGAPIRWRYHTLAPELRPAEEVMGPLIKGCTSNPNIKVYTDTTAASFGGSNGDFSVTLSSGERLRVGAVIVATGFEHFDPRVDPRYGYGRVPDVIGINELEGMLRDGRVVRRDGKPPRRIGFVFCVGSRDRTTNPYCCKVCCGISIKQAIELRKLLPEAQIYMIYMDIRTWGLWEDLYWDSMEKHDIRYIRGRIGEVYHVGDRILAKGEDTLVRGPIEVTFDMLVLAVGMEPGEGTKQAARVFGLDTNQYGFLKPKQPNIHFDSGREGVFLAGACVAPMEIEEAIAEGSAAAMQAAKALLKTTLKGAARV